jgi:DNA (cytosine-5)-methyltransferase 1
VRMLDLFAGCGGMTLGFHDAGFTSVGAIELDHAAAATYAENFRDANMVCGDIVTDFGEVPAADLVIGGPPCQGFSNLGLKDPDDPRNRLWEQYVRVVRESNCQVFVLENVARFAKSDEYKMLHRIARSGCRLEGFTLQTFHLNAADFGLAQRRQRTVLIGSRIGPIAPPNPTHDRDGIGGLPLWRTLRDVLDIEHNLATFVEQTDLPSGSVEHFGRTVRGPFKLDQIHISRNYRDESLQRYQHVKPGENRHAVPEDLLYRCWRGFTTGAGDVLGRLEWNQPSVTIRTEFNKPEKGRYLHPAWDEDPAGSANRALTHAEAAVLQGFDDRHVWCGSKTSIARQIGNAVPPPLAYAIAERVMDLFDTI